MRELSRAEYETLWPGLRKKALYAHIRLLNEIGDNVRVTLREATGDYMVYREQLPLKYEAMLLAAERERGQPFVR